MGWSFKNLLCVGWSFKNFVSWQAVASLGKAQEEAAALTEELSKVRAAEKAAEDYRYCPALSLFLSHTSLPRF